MHPASIEPTADFISSAAWAYANEKINVFNLGNEDTVDVDGVAGIICNEMGLKGVKYSHTGGERGWIGDAPTVLLSTEKIKKLGFQFPGSSAKAVKDAAREMIAEEEIFDKKRNEG